jgi:hypothetical protein
MNAADATPCDPRAEAWDQAVRRRGQALRTLHGALGWVEA